MNETLLASRVGILMLLDGVSPTAAAWLNQQPDPDSEHGEVTAQTVIWVAIAAAGAFAVAVILYNKFRTKANAVDLDNPGALPAG